MRRGPAERRKVEIGGKFVERGDRLDRLRRPDPRDNVEQGHRLDALFAEVRRAVRAQALRQFTFGHHQQGLVRELGRLRPQRLKHLDLSRAVGDVILAANNVGYVEVDIVNDAWQQIEPAAVLPPDDRIA